MIYTPLQAPPNRQATTGLIPLASAYADPPERWEAGFTFDPEPCPDGQVVAVACEQDTVKAPADNPDLVTYLPATLVVANQCSTMARSRDVAAIARRQLLAAQSKLLEQLLWTGQADGDSLPVGGNRPHLADGRATILGASAALDPAVAMAVLDQALTDCLAGAAGMVHMAPYTLVRLAADDLVHQDGTRWRTASGHLVVAGAGYTGGGPRSAPDQALPAAPDLTDPDEGDAWVYGTGPVQYLLGTVDAFGDTDRAVNTDTAYGERVGAAFYSPCCQFAVQVGYAPAP